MSATEASADALVVFGITGDLARKMTLRSLYLLEKRERLDCRVLGVAVEDWSAERLRDHAREVIEQAGEELDEQVFERFARKLDYVSGDFTQAETFDRVRDALADVHNPVFYLEIPPSLFAGVVAGLAKAGLLENGRRVAVEKPFGHDLQSARKLAAELHENLDESQLFRIDHFLGKLGLEEFLYLRFANAVLEPIWNRNYVACVQITMAEKFGVEDRGHFYDPVGALRDVVVNHIMQLIGAAAMEPPAAGDADAMKDAKFAVFRSMADADPEKYVRGQYDGYREIDGVASDSDTETFVALRLEVDNWRWAGVPFLVRAGKRLPVTQTELRLVFRRPPRLPFIHPGHRPAEPSQLVFRIDPHTGVQLILDAQRPDAPGQVGIELDMEYEKEGLRAATPYEVLLHAAIEGDSSMFTRQDSVEETWRVVEPLLEQAPKVLPYKPGTWGPEEAEHLASGHGRWKELWLPEGA